jgi:peptidoglycan/xylan/chitin deacetylase (PgdA/CDA1 family)
MNLLLRWSEPIPASYSQPLESGKRYAAVTFDDGFLTVAQNALPELEKRGIPSTIFIITDFLGKTPPWAAQYSEGDKLDHILTLEELVKMPSELVTIGSHTVTHPDLTTLDPNQALDELLESRRRLENWLGREVRLFSFPYGAHNEAVVGLCREAGYARVFTTLPKLAFAHPEEYMTGRVPVELSDWDIEFVLKLFGAYRWLPYAFSLKRAVRSMLGFRLGKSRLQSAS